MRKYFLIKDDDVDTSKEIQEILVKQQDIFMGIRFVGSAHDGLS
jgi:hypothetical protein